MKIKLKTNKIEQTNKKKAKTKINIIFVLFSMYKKSKRKKRKKKQ